MKLMETLRVSSHRNLDSGSEIKRMANFDLNIIPIHRRAGQDQTSLVGLHAVTAPRRAARGRKIDQLIIMMNFSGPPPFSDERITELIGRLETGYFDTPGSATSASREMIEELNGLLLNINQRSAGSRPPISASLTVLVARHEDLYLAQSGPGHLFVLMPRKVDYIHDEKAAGQGLGTSRGASIHFAQLPLVAGYRLLFTPGDPRYLDLRNFSGSPQPAIPDRPALLYERWRRRCGGGPGGRGAWAWRGLAAERSSFNASAGLCAGSENTAGGSRAGPSCERKLGAS